MDDAVREMVRERAAMRCEYCRIPEIALPWARFHVEHIRARQHGGTDDPENLALACRRCNLLKGPNLSSVDPESNVITRLFHPRLDSWREHFALIDHRIVGLTDVGRATVALLEMNDPDRVQLRVELMELGLDAV
jgi:hypothetical protein